MEIVSVSSKYQVVIPKKIREKMEIKPEKRVIMIPQRGRIAVVRQKEMSEMQEVIKGMDTQVERERGGDCF